MKKSGNNYRLVIILLVILVSFVLIIGVLAQEKQMDVSKFLYGLLGEFAHMTGFSVGSANTRLSIASSAIGGYFTINETPSPVFSTLIPDQVYVIKDNLNYKLYYAGSDFASINLAQSSDGLTWTPYPGNPVITDAGPNDAHADVKYYSDSFTGANMGNNASSQVMHYRVWYEGANGNSIGGWRYAESPDGITWYNRMDVTQYGTPVFSSATGVEYGIADAIYTPGASNTGTDWTFRIYANAQYEVTPFSADEIPLMAFSSNGYNWTGYDPTGAGYATPIFGPTLNYSDFDGAHVGWFKVIENNPRSWEAFYSGGNATTYQALNGIGYATSRDGINWRRVQTLFTSADGVPWRNQSTWMPSVVKNGNNYDIWFLGSDNNMTDGSWIWWMLGHAIITADSTPPNTSASAICSDGIPYSFGTLSNCSHVNITLSCTDGTGSGCDYSQSSAELSSWADDGIIYSAPSGSAYYPSVIHDGNGFGSGNPLYKMWYNDGNGGIFVINSSDGLSWGSRISLTGLGAGVYHAKMLYDGNCFGSVPCDASKTKYRIWYWTGNQDYNISDIMSASSTDGVNYNSAASITQSQSMPLVNNTSFGPSNWNQGTYGPVFLLYNSTASNSGTNPFSYSYTMYYDGTDGSAEYVGLAYSADGLNWTAYSEKPALNVSASGWDSGSVSYGTVYLDSNGYHFWYSGSSISGANEGIGYAYSTDGINWIKNPNPIFSINDGISSHNARAYTPSVVDDGNGMLVMYFTALQTGNPIKSIERAYLNETNPMQISSEGTTQIPYRSIDIAGNLEQIKNNIVKLDRTPPTVNITLPASNSTLSSTTITINLTAFDINLNYTKISVTDANGSSVASSTSSTNGAYSVQITVPLNGEYNITATAHDLAGNSAFSIISNITIFMPIVNPSSSTGSSGSGGGGEGCITNWTCSSWSACSNGQQTRTCSKTLTPCSAEIEPALTQTCRISEISAPATRSLISALENPATFMDIRKNYQTWTYLALGLLAIIAGVLIIIHVHKKHEAVEVKLPTK